MTQNDVVMTAKDISKFFNISLASAYNLMHRNTFPSFEIGKRILVRHSRLMEWIGQQETKGCDKEITLS